MLASSILPLLVLAPATAHPQDPGTRAAAIADAHRDVASVREIGRSRDDRPIRVVTLAAAGAVSPGARPAVLVLAGVDGRHGLGSALAVDQLERLCRGFADGDADVVRLLTTRVVHVVPELDPDGRALGRHGNATSLDVDRDGRVDEDGPRDLDGDGFVAQMRWPDPDGVWLVDADDPRVMRKADAAKGERGTHSLAIEAADTDGDGARGEDEGGGVWLGRNFGHRFTEGDRRAGPFPFSEPETKALADFVFAQRNLTMAFVWDVDDNLLATPKTDEPKARVQLDGILKGDEALWARAGERYRELTQRTGASRARMDGSAWAWLNFQVGALAFASDVWRVPESVGEGDAKHTGDRARLAHCDAVGRGFVAWHAFEHPELGAVELGGFVQDRDAELLPDDAREALFAAHFRFLVEQASHGSELRIRSLEAEPRGGGAFALEAVVVNDGDWPSLTATAERTRRFGAPRVTLQLPDGVALVAGDARTTLGTLAALGGKQEVRWIVQGPPGATVRLELVGDPVGHAVKEVTL